MRRLAGFYWRPTPAVRAVVVVGFFLVGLPLLITGAWPDAPVLPRIPFLLVGVLAFAVPERWHNLRRRAPDSS